MKAIIEQLRDIRASLHRISEMVRDRDIYFTSLLKKEGHKVQERYGKIQKELKAASDELSAVIGILIKNQRKGD